MSALTSQRALLATSVRPRRPHAVSGLCRRTAVRGLAAGPSKERYNYNTSLSFSAEPDPEHATYRRVTAAELASRREPPTRVKMLVRDFIDDSLYNPHYGYFSRNVTIFTPPSAGYDFAQFQDQAAFEDAVAGRYESEYDGLPEGLGRQVWHTPTELFKPHYARALTSAIVAQYRLNHFPHAPLVIYEVGAGNGSFMLDALAYIKSHHPEVFARTKYRIVEISGALAKIQRRRAREAGLEKVVEIVNVDWVKWEGGSREPCYVVALEVFDNLAHDMVRYDLATLAPLQALVSIDASGDFSLLYEPVADPLLARALGYRHLLPSTPSTRPPLSPLLLRSPAARRAYAALPFAANLSAPDFVPTKQVAFLERLRDRLPNHRLLVADFDSLPDAVEGRNGPVVQTRYGGSMVPCETILVKQGLFDIFFPTDFELLRDTYALIMNSPTTLRDDFFSSHPSPITASPGASAVHPTTKPASAAAPAFTPAAASAPAPRPARPIAPTSSGIRGFRRRAISVYTHAAFLETYGGEQLVSQTRTRDGTSAMLGMYGNQCIMF
ncbi:hypothetical protein Q5752_001393 [Cryptotrichosporon argae]